MAKTILFIIGCYLATVIVADIAGVLINTLFDLFAGRSKSKLLYYTVWFVLAIFAGMLYFSFANDYVKTNQTLQKNSWVIFFIAIVLTTVAILIFYAIRQMEESGMYYVPGNPYITYTFFITYILASIFAWYLDQPFSANKTKIN